jgi:hypothetical protein
MRMYILPYALTIGWMYLTLFDGRGEILGFVKYLPSVSFGRVNSDFEYAGDVQDR